MDSGSIFSVITSLLLCELLAELTARPTDVSLRVRLLRLYLDTERLTEAYNHAVELELRSMPGFRDQLQWYDCLIDVFEVSLFINFTHWIQKGTLLILSITEF